MRRISIASLVLLFLAMFCHAQTATVSSAGVLDGTVTDASGAVVVGATVTVTNSAGKAGAAVSDSAGKFRITGLAPGQYTLSVTMKGFTEFKTEGLNVNPGETITLDAQLQAAGSSTEVNVVGQRT